jgi:hypothetical protein
MKDSRWGSGMKVARSASAIARKWKPLQILRPSLHSPPEGEGKYSATSIFHIFYDRAYFVVFRKSARSLFEAARYRASASRFEAARYRASASRTAPTVLRQQGSNIPLWNLSDGDAGNLFRCLQIDD